MQAGAWPLPWASPPLSTRAISRCGWDRRDGQGAYVALPTMATSNQMFDRVGKFLEANAGKKNLIAAFYRSIATEAPVPIPYREILRTARLMDAIFEQVGRVVSC